MTSAIWALEREAITVNTLKNDKKHKKEDLEILKNDVEIQKIIENLGKKGDKDKQDGEI